MLKTKPKTHINMETKLIIALLIMVAVLIIATYLAARYKAKKYCEWNKLDFHKFWHDEVRGKVDRSSPYWMLNYKISIVVVCCVAASCVLAGCSTTHYVPVVENHTDTLYISKEKRDSIWMHDSIHIKEKGDSILIEKWHTKYIEKILHDTIIHHQTDTIPKPYEVVREVKVEKELSWWQRTKMIMGQTLLVILAGLCLFGLWKLYLRIKK